MHFHPPFSHMYTNLATIQKKVLIINCKVKVNSKGECQGHSCVKGKVNTRAKGQGQANAATAQSHPIQRQSSYLKKTTFFKGVNDSPKTYSLAIFNWLRRWLTLENLCRHGFHSTANNMLVVCFVMTRKTLACVFYIYTTWLAPRSWSFTLGTSLTLQFYSILTFLKRSTFQYRGIWKLKTYLLI